MANRTGVLIAGLAGMTGSTAAFGLVAIGRRFLPPVFGITSSLDFGSRPLSDLDGWVIGGWDHDLRPLVEIIRDYGLISSGLNESATHLSSISPYPAIIGTLDAKPRGGLESSIVSKSLHDGACRVQQDIERFREQHNCDQVIVVYLASPPRFSKIDFGGDLTAYKHDFAGVHCYLLGAIKASAHFVDFTPTDALEHPVFQEMATRSGSQLAGRDGSTGQTMLKLHVAELLRRRSLRLRAWYSTNILGNNDGRVLTIPEHRVVKIHDKTAGLAEVLGYDDFDHVVDISFVRSHGDAKEAWDVVECEGWLGSSVSLRMNWRGGDSLLAAPMVLDLCRLIEQGARRGRVGLQAGLGFFFKNPIGCQDARPSVLYRQLLEWVDANLAS